MMERPARRRNQLEASRGFEAGDDAAPSKRSGVLGGRRRAAVASSLGRSAMPRPSAPARPAVLAKASMLSARMSPTLRRIAGAPPQPQRHRSVWIAAAGRRCPPAWRPALGREHPGLASMGTIARPLSPPASPPSAPASPAPRPRPNRLGRANTNVHDDVTICGWNSPKPSANALRRAFRRGAAMSGRRTRKRSTPSRMWPDTAANGAGCPAGSAIGAPSTCG